MNEPAPATSALRVVHPADRITETASGELRREAAISGGLVGAEKMWFGYAELAPGAASAVHHHGESESGIYVIAGQARFCSGPDLDDVQDATAGDFVWVPPNIVHVEINVSDEEPVRMAVSRTTQDAIVVNLPTPDGWQPPR